MSFEASKFPSASQPLDGILGLNERKRVQMKEREGGGGLDTRKESFHVIRFLTLLDFAKGDF